MKKIWTAIALVWIVGLNSWAVQNNEPHYVNLSFTVWQLESGPLEAVCMINIPIPKVFRESWFCDFVSFDVSNGRAPSKVVEKEGFRFVLIAEHKDRLTIQVFEKDIEIFRFLHNRPSTIDYIFHGADGRTYLMELTYTAGNHPIGLLSPGILKK